MALLDSIEAFDFSLLRANVRGPDHGTDEACQKRARAPLGACQNCPPARRGEKFGDRGECEAGGGV